MSRRILLAGYKGDSEADRRVREHYEQQGYEVVTYNKEQGRADSTDIFSAAGGVDEVVNMSKPTPDNSGFHNLCARVAGDKGATLSRRPDIDKS